MSARFSVVPRILPRELAAVYCGFESANQAFDTFAQKMGFKKIPGRKGCYDRKQIDAALDANMGLLQGAKEDMAQAWIAQHG